MITGRVNIAGWQKQARELLARSGKPEAEFLKDEGRLMCVALVESTPPKRKDQGENAIAGDLARIFEARNRDYLRFLEDQFGREIAQQTLRNKRGEPYMIDKAIIDPDGGDMKEWHRSHMISGRKRTRGYGQKGWSKDTGRHVARDQMWVGYDAYKAYFEDVKSRVGFTKSAWVKALFDLGGKAKGQKLPSWVERHFDNGKPKGGADLSGLTGKWQKSLLIGNWTPQVEQILGRSVEYAVKRRTSAMRTRLRRGIATGDWSNRWK